MKGLLITFSNPEAVQVYAERIECAHKGAEITVGQNSTLRITYPPQLPDEFVDTLIEGISNALKERGHKVENLS